LCLTWFVNNADDLWPLLSSDRHVAQLNYVITSR
jgi:hypothetical protein